MSRSCRRASLAIRLSIALATMLGATARADVSLDANRLILEAVKTHRLSPPATTRVLALFHLAAWRSLDRAPVGDDDLARARVLGAFATVWSHAFEENDVSGPEWVARLVPGLLRSGVSEADVRIALEDGKWEAERLLRSRKDDARLAGAPDSLTSPTASGYPVWAPAPGRSALHPRWGELPFLLATEGIPALSAPPAPGSWAFTRDVLETARVGSESSSGSTEETRLVALFWAQGNGTVTPPGQWNRVAQALVEAEGLGVRDEARLLMELNVALFDTSIHCWREKYRHRAPRPENAMAKLVPSLDWTPVLATPPHPEYPSGHSAFSGAAATVLSRWRVTSSADVEVTSEEVPGVVRSFPDFHAAAREAGLSRIYGGIHFPSANRAGLRLGADVAGAVLSRLPRR